MTMACNLCGPLIPCSDNQRDVHVNSKVPIDVICVQACPVKPTWLLDGTSHRLLPGAALWWQPGQNPAADLPAEFSELVLGPVMDKVKSAAKGLASQRIL